MIKTEFQLIKSLLTNKPTEYSDRAIYEPCEPLLFGINTNNIAQKLKESMVFNKSWINNFQIQWDSI